MLLLRCLRVFLASTFNAINNISGYLLHVQEKTLKLLSYEIAHFTTEVSTWLSLLTMSSNVDDTATCGVDICVLIDLWT